MCCNYYIIHVSKITEIKSMRVHLCTRFPCGLCPRRSPCVDMSVALTMVVAKRKDMYDVDVATSIRTAKYHKIIKFDLNTV